MLGEDKLSRAFTLAVGVVKENLFLDSSEHERAVSEKTHIGSATGTFPSAR